MPALPFVDFTLRDGVLVTENGHPGSRFNTVLGVREGRLYLARFLMLLTGAFGDFPAKTPVFLVPSDKKGRDTFLGNWCEAVAAWVQKRRIMRMRADFGIGTDSYLSVWDNGVELQFYFYPEPLPPVAAEILPEAVDMPAELHTMSGTMTTIKPISDRVFLEPMEEDRMTKSGIVLPDSAEKERPVKGRVLAVGAGKLNDNGGRNAMSVKVGDVVLFKKYGPDEIELEGKKYLVAEESDILAILES